MSLQVCSACPENTVREEILNRKHDQRNKKKENPDYRETSTGVYFYENIGSFPGIDPDALKTSLRYLRTLKRTMKKLEEYFAEHDISPGKLSILIALARAEDTDGVLPSGLADSIGVTRGTITGLLDGLEKQSYVERRIRSDEDRRKVRVILTPAGRSFLAGFLPLHYRRMTDITRNLDPAERIQFTGLLRKIEENLEDIHS